MDQIEEARGRTNASACHGPTSSAAASRHGHCVSWIDLSDRIEDEMYSDLENV